MFGSRVRIFQGTFFCNFRKTKKHDLQNMTTPRAPRCIEPRSQPETFFSSVFGLDLCEFWIPFCCQFRFRFRWELDSDLANIWVANCLKIFHKILQNFVGNLLNVASTWQRHLSRVLYDRMTLVLTQYAKHFWPNAEEILQTISVENPIQKSAKSESKPHENPNQLLGQNGIKNRWKPNPKSSEIWI